MTESAPRTTVLAALALLAALSCASADDYAPQDGDIIFQTSRSAQSVAVQKATGSPYSHMGIIFLRDDMPFVLEAVEPVRFTPLPDWINRGERHHYVVKRLRDADGALTPGGLLRMREIGEELLGRHYDPYFEWSDDRIYCSELVFKIYERAVGIEVGEVRTLDTFDLSDPAVQAKARERWGGAPPLQEKVISPAAIFASDRLATVFESPTSGIASTRAPATAENPDASLRSAGPASIDHLILAVNDLQAGVDMFEKQTGVRAVIGGRHPHLGTQNALIALGPRLYLEILAPQTEMELVSGMEWLNDVTELEPMGWAASTGDIDGLIQMLRGQGYQTTAGAPGSRARPDGAMLTWTTMGLTAPAIPAAPFFIEWGATTEHPATTSPAGCRLDRLTVVSPDTGPLSRLLELLHIDAGVKPGDQPAPILNFKLTCPKGPVEFTGFAGSLPSGE